MTAKASAGFCKGDDGNPKEMDVTSKGLNEQSLSKIATCATVIRYWSDSYSFGFPSVKKDHNNFVFV